MKKKIIIASDSFKGSLTSREVGEAAREAVKSVMPGNECEVIPIADGGEGTVDALVSALKGEAIKTDATDPLGRSIKATYGICGDTAVIEIAAASGITLVEEKERNPMLASTFGTGLLIADAVRKGCRKFLIGLGGSATNDGGIGMLKALGFRFLDKHGREVEEGGRGLSEIEWIDDSHVMPELENCSFTVACDVTNPLTGPNGASYVFGGQKGADNVMMEKLDEGLRNFANVVSSKYGKDLSGFKGAGAAGGLGFAFLSFLRAELKPGIEMVLDAVGFDQRLKEAALVITGEGRLDQQTCMGKAPYGVLKRAMKKDVPVIAIGGAVVPEAVESLMKAGFSAVFPIVAGPVELSEALKPEVAKRNIRRTVSQILRAISVSI